MKQLTNSPSGPPPIVRHLAIGGVVFSPLLVLTAAADPFQPVRLMVIAAALGLAFIFAPKFEMSRRELGVAVVATAVLGLFLISAADSVPSSLFGVHGRFQGLVSLVLYMLAGAAGLLVLGRSVRQGARWIAAVVIVEAVIVAVQSATGAEPVGTIGNQVLIGAWMAVGVAVLVAAARVESGKMRVMYLVASVAGAIALGAIGSRGAWVGLAFGVIPVLIAGRFSVRKAWPALAVILLLVAGAVLAGGDAAAKLDPSALTRSSAASRWQIWAGTTAMIGDQPLLGVGPGRFLYEYPAYQTPEHALIDGVDVRADVAHSHALQTAAEAGLPAALALAALAGLALFTGLGAARRGDALALVATAGLAAYLGQGLFGIGAVETDALGWLLGGMALSRGVAGSEVKLTIRPGIVRAVGVGVCVMILCAGAYYLSADIRYGSGLDSFSAGLFAESFEAHTSAVEQNPLVDVYRVAAADAAMYGGGSLNETDRLLTEGLELESDSYDLALAHARILGVWEGVPIDVLADAYSEAAALYPLGVQVRREAIPVLVEAGREAEAMEMAQIVLTQVPEDPVARSVVGDDE